MTTVISRKPALKPEHFRTRLYAALIDVGLRQLLPRVEVEWGQPMIVFTDLEDANYVGIGIYDRDDGGESLAEGYMDKGPVGAFRGDTIQCFVSWS